MGGPGSGNRWQWGARPTVTDFRPLDVRRLARDDLLRPGLRYGWRWSRGGETTGLINIEVGEGRLVLDYRTCATGGEWEPMRYPALLEETACHLGGERTWFQCPLCGARVALLYGGKVFACRKCHGLAYPSQRENLSDRAARRADKIRERLGWECGFLNGHGLKPKGMHRKTYQRLVAEHDRWARASCSAMLQHFAQFDGFDAVYETDLQNLIGG